MAGALSIPRFGLYYPYINFRDEGWAKVAALYWPKMARIVPAGYPTRNLPAVQALIDALDWTIDIRPEEVRSQVAPMFEELVSKLGEDADEWLPGYFYDVDPDADDAATTPPWGDGAGRGILWGKRMDDRVAGIHSTEFDPQLSEKLIRLGYANPAVRGVIDTGRGWAAPPPENRARSFVADFVGEGGWLVMQRDLVWIYKTLMSQALADRNRLALTTDQVGAHSAASGLSATQLALGGVAGETVDTDLATAFGLAALRTVIPSDIDNVPVAKIIEIRQRFGAQFDAWREHIDVVGAELKEQLLDVESPVVLQRYIDEAARKYAEAPVAKLRDGLTSLGVDVGEAALNTKFETPAAIAAAGLATGNPIGIAVGAAVGLVQLRRNTAKQAQAQLASPNAYLLTLRENLEPRPWIQRVFVAMRAAAGLRG